MIPVADGRLHHHQRATAEASLPLPSGLRSPAAGRLPEAFRGAGRLRGRTGQALLWGCQVIERPPGVEAGVPVAATPAPKGEGPCGVFPAGAVPGGGAHRFPDGMSKAVAAVRGWAGQRRLMVDTSPTPEKKAVGPEMDRRQTAPAFRLADQ